MSEDNITVDVLLKFSADAYSKMEMGVIPSGFPGDRYFMFMEENIFYIGTVRGICIFKLWFSPAGSDYQVTKIQLAANREFDTDVQIKRDLSTIGMILHDAFRVKFQSTPRTAQ